VITDLQQAQLDEAVAAIGPNCSGIVADVTKLADMEAIFREVIERHGRLDAVVANAGIGDHAPLGSITEEQFDRTFNVNAKGVLFTVQPALPLLPPGGRSSSSGPQRPFSPRPG